MVVESGEKLEGMNGAGWWPRTGEFTRVRVARYCASQLPWITGAIFCSVLKITRSKLATKLARLTKARQGEAEGAWLQPTGSNLGFTPNVGMEIGNRMFHAGCKPRQEGW